MTPLRPQLFLISLFFSLLWNYEAFEGGKNIVTVSVLICLAFRTIKIGFPIKRKEVHLVVSSLFLLFFVLNWWRWWWICITFSVGRKRMMLICPEIRWVLVWTFATYVSKTRIRISLLYSMCVFCVFMLKKMQKLSISLLECYNFLAILRDKTFWFCLKQLCVALHCTYYFWKLRMPSSLIMRNLSIVKLMLQ